MSILLTVQDLEKSFGERQLFQSLSFVISEKERIGLIGPNGAGKSTLLKIIAQEESADGGELIPTRGLHLRYVSQTPQFKNDQSVIECLSESLQSMDSWEKDQKIEEAFWRYGLEFAELDRNRKVGELSGGWQKRLAILRELIAEPDLLLLDEPTNHLDVHGIFWLEELLSSLPFASLTITHDRYFLDKVSNRIIELDQRHENGMLSVEGNYSRYLEVRDAIMEAQENREQILRGVLRRETEWLKAGVKARTTKQQARIQRHGEIKSELGQVARRNIKSKVEMEFQSAEDKPKRLIEAKQVSKSYGDSMLFKKLDLLLGPGMCVGLLGENGCGKSSLIRVLLGQEKPDEGSIFHSDLLKVAYFEQGKEQVDPKLTLIQSICPDGDRVYYRGRHIHVRSYLERFLFQQEKMDLPVGSLSGGEQSRLLLAKLMLIEANVLVLDEPTNDLDIATLNVLEDCLQEFDGAILLVTHDRFFLDRVSTQLLAFPPKTAQKKNPQLQFFASFDQWKEWFDSFGATSSTKTLKKEKKTHKNSSSESQQSLMKKIEKLESTYKDLELECSKPEISSNFEELAKYGEKMTKIQFELEELYTRWSESEQS